MCVCMCFPSLDHPPQAGLPQEVEALGWSKSCRIRLQGLGLSGFWAHGCEAGPSWGHRRLQEQPLGIHQLLLSNPGAALHEQ